MSPLPLLLLPGLTCDERLWQHQTAALGADREVSSFALLPEDSMVELARSALAQMPAERFALAGLSMGGYLALEIVRQAPERVAGLALLDTNAHADAQEARDHRRELMAQARSDYGSAVLQLLPKLLHPAHLGDTALVSLIADMAARVGVDGFISQQTAIMGRADSRPLLKDIVCPTLVLCGRQDELTPLALHEEMHAGIGSSQLVVLDRCGHLSSMEQPDEVTAALREWLSAVDLRA